MELNLGGGRDGACVVTAAGMRDRHTELQSALDITGAGSAGCVAAGMHDERRPVRPLGL